MVNAKPKSWGGTARVWYPREGKGLLSVPSGRAMFRAHMSPVTGRKRECTELRPTVEFTTPATFQASITSRRFTAGLIVPGGRLWPTVGAGETLPDSTVAILRRRRFTPAPPCG